ncbi:MAG: hypothetical protein RLZZ401_908 [Pseudomonadota bacterium]
MPSNQTPLGALPARFRRLRVLVVGCGDVGQRAAGLLHGVHVLALTSSPERRAALRRQGITPLRGDLDQAGTLARLAGLAQRVIHLAPPPSAGRVDSRTVNLVRALRLRGVPDALVYGSTSGVYGDCQGQLVPETRSPHPQSPRAQRRAHAESVLRAVGRATGVRVSLLRIPGIYAMDRPGGSPLERVRRGTPVLQVQDDVYTSHIHADDLARACVLALWRGRAQRVVNVNDDTRLLMGDYFDQVADGAGLARPPRLSRTQAPTQLTPMQMSFLGESRRLDNQRMKRELRLRLRYPTVVDGLRPAPG